MTNSNDNTPFVANNRLVMSISLMAVLTIIIWLAASNPSAAQNASTQLDTAPSPTNTSDGSASTLTENVDLLSVPRPRLTTQTSLIGNGQYAMILIYKHDIKASRDLAASVMASQSQLPADVKTKINFILVDADTLSGKEFMEENQAEPSMLMLFSPDGKKQGVLYSPQTTDFLVKAIENALQLGPGI